MTCTNGSADRRDLSEADSPLCPFANRSFIYRAIDAFYPKNGSSSPSTATGPHVYAAAGCITQSPIGRRAEQLSGQIRVRGAKKVMAQMMFGVLALTVDQLSRLHR